MAKGKKTGGRNFAFGNCANPLGAKAHDPVLKAVRRLTRAEIADIGTLLLDQNYTELERIAKDPNTPALRLLIIKVVSQAIVKGDSRAMQIILDAFAGKQRISLEVTGAEGGPINFSSLSESELDKKINELVAKAQK